MARKKKHHKKTTHHRRRVGALHMGGGFMEAVAVVFGVGLGVVAGRMVNNMINPPTSTTPSISPTILGFVEGGAGAFVSTKLKGKTGGINALVKGAAAGFGGNGLMYAVSSKGLGLLPATIGYGPDPTRPMPFRAQLQGFRDVPKIGFPKPGAIGSGRDGSRMARMYAGIYG